MTAAGLVVVVSGPSGVGKGTVHARVRSALPDSRLAVSVTTRTPRTEERDGVDYHFVDDPTFDELVADGALLEHATYAGNRYGTPRTDVERAVDAGLIVILDIDVQGALQIRRAVPHALLVFLEPPSIDELESRLRSRGTEEEHAVRRRLERAREELAHRGTFDLVVVNDDVDRCVAMVLDAILDARRVLTDGSPRDD